MRKIPCFILLAVLLLYVGGLSANPKREILQMANYVKNINSFNNLHPQEKVYLHFDNNIYFLGDTLWFKSYLINTKQNKFSDLSKVLYVELLTQDGRLIDTKKLKVENGQCHGEFVLKHTYLSGFYEVRAYTRYMLNWGGDHIFSRVFPVYMEPDKLGDYSNIKIMEEPYRDSERKRPNQELLKEVNLNFYPEGGNMLVGRESRVAFKLTGKKGEGLDVEGRVYNSKGEEVVRFSPLHEGMGDFLFRPDGGRYRASVIYKSKEYKFDLPSAQPDGYSMFVDNLNNDSIRIEINSTQKLNTKILGLSIMCRGHIFFFNILDLDKSGKLTIPRSIFPSGVQNITLFNNLGEILAYRLIFVDKEDNQKLYHTEVKSSYNPFEYVQMDFFVADKSKTPLETSLSLSIRDASASFVNSYEDNIKTNLLLSSELKGYIHQPGYYFSSDDNKCKKSLDLLMMVQGWRRYEWKQMAGFEPFTVDHQVEGGLLVKGKVLSWFRKKEKENMDVLCWLMKDGASLKGTAKTDENGSFAFLVDSVDIYGKWQLGLQGTEKGKRKDNRIVLDRFFSPKPRPYLVTETEVKDSLVVLPEDISEINSLEKMQILPEFVLKRRINRKRPNLVYDVERDVNEAVDKQEYIPPRVKDYLDMKHSGFLANPSRSIVLTRNMSGKWVSNEFLSSNVSQKEDNSIGVSDIHTMNNATMIDIEEVEKIVLIRTRDSLDNYIDIPDIQEGIALQIKDNLRDNIYTDTSYEEFKKEREKASQFGVEELNVGENAPTLFRGELDNSRLVSFSAKYITDVFLVYRYPDNLGEYKKGVRHTYFDGYSQVADFYNSDYSVNPIIPGDVDYRRTLYWNPNLKTNKEGKATVGFYNNSVGKQIVVSCEGISSMGDPITVAE